MLYDGSFHERVSPMRRLQVLLNQEVVVGVLGVIRAREPENGVSIKIMFISLARNFST